MHTHMHINTYTHTYTHAYMPACIHTYILAYIYTFLNTQTEQEVSVMMSKPGLANMLYRSDISDWRFIFPGPFALAFGIFYQICHWKSCGSQATLCYMCDFWSWHFLAHKRKVRRLTPPERADNLNSFTPKSPEVCGRSLNRCWNMTSFWRLGRGGCRVIMYDYDLHSVPCLLFRTFGMTVKAFVPCQVKSVASMWTNCTLGLIFQNRTNGANIWGALNFASQEAQSSSPTLLLPLPS